MKSLSLLDLLRLLPCILTRYSGENELQMYKIMAYQQKLICKVCKEELSIISKLMEHKLNTHIKTFRDDSF